MSETVVEPPVEPIVEQAEGSEPLAGTEFKSFTSLFDAPDEPEPEKPPVEVKKATPEPVKEIKEEPLIPESAKDEPEKAPEGLSPKAGAAWEKKNDTIKALKAEVASTKEAVQQTEQRFANYLPPEKAQELQKKVQDQQTQLEQQETVITKIRHEMHPEYKKSVAVPLENTIKKANGIAERNQISQGLFLSAIADPDPAKLDNLVVDLSDRDKLAAYQLAERYQELQADKAERDQRAAEELNQWNEDGRKEQEYSQAQQQQARTRDIEERLPNVEKRFARFAETDEEKGVLKTAVDIAKQDVMWQKEPAIQAAAALALAMSPIIMKKNTALADENAALKAQLSGYRKTEPGAGGGPQPSSQAVADDDDNLDIIGNIKRNAVPVYQR